MANSPESDSVVSNTMESVDSNVLLNTKTVVDVHPLAFTIEFNDQKVDEARKSKVHERLSAFTLKHRRNPSLPDFGAVRNAKSSPPTEKLLPSPVNSQHVPVIGRGTPKFSMKFPPEGQWKSSALKACVKASDLKSPVILRSLEVNGVRDNFLKHFKNGRRNSLNDIDSGRHTSQIEMPSSLEFKSNRNGTSENERVTDPENKSDTVSEAGTYTVDKDDENPENEADRTEDFCENEDNGDDCVNECKKSYRSSWINDWVRDVEEQNRQNSAPKEPPPIPSKTSGSGRSSPGVSKIPSPINTLSRKAKMRGVKLGETFSAKLNGTILHRRSSSLSAKDCNENHGSESSLETESFLRTTESVVAAMQNRMRMSLDGRGSSDVRKLDKRDFSQKERPHPPSTASDTDTNSETDDKTFKKPIGNPFTSARLNRAFSSLRRAKADPGSEVGKKKSAVSGEAKHSNTNSVRSTPSPKPVHSKPPTSTPFSRTDCGRFSMRSTVSSIRSTSSSQSQKKEAKKQNGSSNRSASSLSSREVEFQNWRRRKSFDPMKAAAEGRKKELAKKAAMNQTMTQSANLGNGTRSRGGLNPVLRSASFHSTAQVFGGGEDDREDFHDQASTDDQEESMASSWASNHRSLLYNSPTQACTRCSLVSRAPVCTSRCSLVSESHSSPSRRMRSDDLDSLVMTAISDLSYKLKLKSCNLLKKVNYLYDPNDEKSIRLREEITLLETRRNSAKNSPIHQAASRDLSLILKNLKGMENALKVLDDVLFEENLEIYVNE